MDTMSAVRAVCATVAANLVTAAIFELRSTHTDALLANARHYQRRLFRPGAPRRPRTGVAVVTCMDARIKVYSLLGLTNAGGVVTEDVIRSLTISQRLLNTRAFMIIMHAACGLREITDDQFTAELQADVGVRPTWRAATFCDTTSEVQHGIARLSSSLFLHHGTTIRGFLHHGTTIRGFLLDDTTDALREIDTAASPLRDVSRGQAWTAVRSSSPNLWAAE
jgi:carbonic anhydrase